MRPATGSRPAAASIHVLSSHSDLDYLGALIGRAGFHARLVAKRWILIESLFIYELQAPRSFMTPQVDFGGEGAD